jgi:hypothetical protein
MMFGRVRKIHKVPTRHFCFFVNSHSIWLITLILGCDNPGECMNQPDGLDLDGNSGWLHATNSCVLVERCLG